MRMMMMMEMQMKSTREVRRCIKTNYSPSLTLFKLILYDDSIHPF
jgi:hypothetical protein